MSRDLRILIVDDDKMMAKTLKDILSRNMMQVDTVHLASDALEKIDQLPYDCVLSDIKMPEMNGIEFYHAVKKRHPALPVVMMTAYSDNQLIQEGLDAGVVAVLSKPLNIKKFFGFAARVMKERTTIIVDDDPRFCRTLRDILVSKGHKVIEITDPSTVMDEIDENTDVALLDMKLNGVGGLEVMREIQKKYPDLPVIVITGHREEMASAIEKAMELGAYSYFYKPLQIDDLIEVLNTLRCRQLGEALE